MQKLTYLLTYLPIGYIETVRFLTIGKVVSVQSLDIGKPDIYNRKDKVGRKPNLVIIGNLNKNLLPPYLIVYGDRYPAYQ